MNGVNCITSVLRPYLNWDKARLHILALSLVALFRVETVDLDKLASVFANRIQSAANYKRLQHFLHYFGIDSDEIVRIGGELEPNLAAVDLIAVPTRVKYRFGTKANLRRATSVLN